MSANANLSEASLIDNIFEGRNKSYGAYELRTNSSKRTVVALILSSIFFIGMVVALYFTMKSKEKVEEKITKVELKKVNTPLKKEEKIFGKRNQIYCCLSNFRLGPPSQQVIYLQRSKTREHSIR